MLNIVIFVVSTSELCKAQFMPGQYPMGPMVPPMSMGPMPMQMPMGAPPIIPMPMGPQKMPVVVMPFYSRDADKKRLPKRSSKKKQLLSMSARMGMDREVDDFKKTRRLGSRHHMVLTPVVSYVTKEGYVVYQKKISSRKAKDWLSNDDKDEESKSMEDKNMSEMDSSESEERKPSKRRRVFD